MKARRATTTKKSTALARRIGPAPALAKLATEIRDLIEAARSHVSVTANLAMVNLYWNIGRVIAQDIQKNEKRAEYGAGLLKELAGVLTHEFGQGYSRANLQDMRRFFESFKICQPVAGKSGELAIRQPVAGKSLSTCGLPDPYGVLSDRIAIDFREHFRLGWTHYRMLLSISNPTQRRFYFEQAADQHWSKREFRRQIDRGLFERVTLSRDTARLVAQEKEASPAEAFQYEGIFKDPYVLDFLGLKGAYSERDLEAAIVHNLEQFLTELGTDFCFVGRQRAMRIDEDDYFLDLLFYHRGLRCLVAIDLKIGTFTASDKRLLEERLRMYSRLLKDTDCESAEQTN